MVLTFHISCLALFGSASVSFAWRGFANDELKIVTKVVYRDVPPGLLSNLPTLPPATYCTQTLADGREFLVTKTGATCPILSASRTSSSSYVEVSAPSPGSSSGLRGSSDQGLDSKCSIFQRHVIDANGKSSWIPENEETGKEMCMDYCSERIRALLDQNQVGSATCVAFGNPILWQDYGVAGEQVAMGNCVCNNPFLDELVYNFTTEALPAIGEVTCKTFVTAISSVINIGLNALPGLGGLIGGAATIALQAAQVAAWTFDNQQAAAGGFQAWLEKPSGATGPPDNPSTWLPDQICGNKYTPADGEKVFAAFDVASSSIGAGALWKNLPKDMLWPPPFPKGSGSLDDMLSYLGGLKPKPKDDAPKDKPEPPKSVAPTDDPPKSKAPEKSSSARACTRANGKRAPVNGQQDRDCEKITVTHILNSKTLDAKHTIASTCDWLAWPVACAHYYSAIHADARKPGKSMFTCNDQMDREPQKYVGEWYKQHNEVWTRFADPGYVFNGKAQKHNKKKLRCEADEWPPAYFVPKEGVNGPEWGQKIRYLAKEENGGAASLWRGFCAEHDGGKGNGQRLKPPSKQKKPGDPDEDGGADEGLNQVERLPINGALLQEKKVPPPDKKREGKDGTVTEEYNMLTFTRAVFEMKFNFGETPPSEENEWYLRENPCWPQDIAPDDPGFVLLTDDPYYDHNPKAKATVASYAEPPSRKRFDEANAARVKRLGSQYEVSDEDVPAADPPPPKAKKPNPPSGSNARRKRLELVGDRIHLRDIESNVTRPLTEEELKENVEITRCADRKCLQEEQDDSLIIPGVGRPSLPSETVAITTLVTRVLPSQVEVRRSPLSADLPVVTAMIEAPRPFHAKRI